MLTASRTHERPASLQLAQNIDDLIPSNPSSRLLLLQSDLIDIQPPTPKATGNLLRSSPDIELRNIRALRDDEKIESPVTAAVSDGLLDSDHNDSKAQPAPPRFQPDTALSPHPLFPPLPTYSPPSLALALRCLAVRCVSYVLSVLFLGVIFGGAIAGLAGMQLTNLWLRLSGQDPAARRKFHTEERERQRDRDEQARRWKRRQAKRDADEEGRDEYSPLEGGRDLLVCDVAYYARRVGLDVETFRVQTEDGFVITLWHVYNPQEYTPLSAEERGPRGPHVFTGKRGLGPASERDRRYPVLLVHGLLQSAGAFCTNDDDSLAFYLCKSGYDVWLGNNRCGMTPEHTTLATSDPRMWSWNIRHLGVLDLTALISRVLYETGFEKLGLVCHSQGTAQTFVALSKDQRPELGERISVFCALAPAVYAGPLLERVYFRFMRGLSPSGFRVFFGIHAFIPIMMTMHGLLHPRIYGVLGYHVFAHLFGWSDTRWDRGLRDRMFQFAPVYVSSETMRWWLGQGCFATQRCILATLEDTLAEMEEDEAGLSAAERDREGAIRANAAWYGPQTPPFALWVAGSDALVDGRRLLRRLQSGREPHVRVVHSKVVDGYEHLDVLWAMDMVDQVGREVRQMVWMTMPEEARRVCRMPRGCSTS
ncbi:putative ab-hydrolase associated lipase [Aspergillus clavatus NRRL 1]|uniref:Ab-hydrolase associated lipase, putative n=1 Tax=Aspergillus clavatus (strain ATCC 1007 / CBS 513.65 / DSM 816 / NCTC 3887 / NRRL 1 / QM 1276 / 107) TaxID=344612 RepID=A1C786_ASPCL|nr:ab-hydrolase associated lipase, putative [Aspergillus clavatus NRRL 1]EAW14257.1 ab-hydrolase associated lipase, putative [Aspergillus clavatus NRRL 1]